MMIGTTAVPPIDDADVIQRLKSVAQKFMSPFKLFSAGRNKRFLMAGTCSTKEYTLVQLIKNRFCFVSSSSQIEGAA